MLIGKPIRSLQIMLRFVAAGNDRVDTVVPDGIYGEDTRRAVITFQREHGLPVTGVVDWETWDRLVAVYERDRILRGEAEPLRFYLQPEQIILPGESNDHMYAINGVLQALSRQYASMPMADSGGELTPQSTEAVKWLQQRGKLEPTGALDRHTWRMIAGLYRGVIGDGTGKRG